MVVLTVPGRQLFQIEPERVVFGYEVALYHPIDIGSPYWFGGRQLRPQRVDDAVADVLPLSGAMHLSVFRVPHAPFHQPVLHAPCHHIIPEHDAVAEKGLDIRH